MYHGRYGILSDCLRFLQQQTSFSQFLKNKTPFLKFWKKKLPLLALPCPSSLSMFDAAYGWSEIFSRPLFYAGVFLQNFKKQNSFYRIRWHSPLPWRRTENAVQSGANHLIRQVILPCECYLSVMPYLKRSFVDYNIIKNSPFDPSIRLPLKVKKTPFEHQQNSHPTYI